MDIFQAIRTRNWDEVNRLLLNPRLNVNQLDEGWTPLTMVISAGQFNLVRRLIDHGADINLAGVLGSTPLMQAVRQRNRDMVTLLLEQEGINVNAINTIGRTALLDATLDIAGLGGQNRAALQEIIEMLLGSGADPNIMTVVDGRTALGNAVRNNDVKLARLLVDNGADVNQRRFNGQTYLSQAAWSQQAEVLAYLLSLPNVDIDAVDNNGQTALILAVRSSPLYVRRIAAMLLEAGIDPLVKSKDGRTARQYADNPLVVEMLERAENIWRAEEAKALQELQQKFIVSRRLRQGTNPQLELPQRQLPEYIIRRAEYDNLCVGSHNNLNKPGVVALAKSLKIPTSNLTKIQLCGEIAKQIIK